MSRLRRDVRLPSSEIEQLIAADFDSTPAAHFLMRAEADLVLYVEKRERLAPAARECDPLSLRILGLRAQIGELSSTIR